MSHRRIVDDQKRVWDVWEVIPSRVATRTTATGTGAPARTAAHKRIVVPPELENGWLAFQCGEERRRIAPLPEGWIELSDSGLLGLLQRARDTSRRTRPQA